MKKNYIDKIITEGSVKQKIKLYMTDAALFNINYSKDKKLLTDNERQIIWESIKEPKDAKYYEELRVRNKAFLMFKAHISQYRLTFVYYQSLLVKYTDQSLLHYHYESLINDLLKLQQDKDTRVKAIKMVLESNKPYTTVSVEKNGVGESIKVLEGESFEDLLLSVKMINDESLKVKEFIGQISLFLDKKLPLQPYKDFVKEEEDAIVKAINQCIESLTRYKLSERVSGLELVQSLDINRWEDIEVEIKDEDIEDISNAGI